MNRVIRSGAVNRAALAWRTAARRASAASRWAQAYWPGRRTVLMTAGMVFLFLFAGASTASAADGDTEQGGVLAPLNVTSSQGFPLDSYDLKSENGGTTDIRSHICNLLIGGGFAMVRMVVGLMCWVIKWVFNFPIVSSLVGTPGKPGVADKLASTYFNLAANQLSLYALFLAGAFAFGLILVMRGKFARGFGEIGLTLVLCTLVVLPALSPMSILGSQGPVAQSQQAAHEVGQMTANVNGVDPGCTKPDDLKDPSCPMRIVLTRTLVVQPFELLQYGVILDPKSSNAHIRDLAEVNREWLNGEIKSNKDNENCTDWMGNNICADDSAFNNLEDELKKHGDEGKAAYNFARNSNWDRVGGVLLVLVAAVLIAMVILSMALVHLGTQFADVIAATCTPVALIWAMLPGGNRAALWKWLGVFMTSCVTEFAVSSLLPAFGLGTDAVLNSPQGTVMIQRLFLMDGLAIVLLVFHRRIFAATGRLGDRFAQRMRYAKIGGSTMSGDESRLGLAMSQAMGGMNAGGGGGYGGLGAGGGLFSSGSPAHAALMRKSRIAQGLAAIGDPGLGPMNAGAMGMNAFGEVRRGWAALSLPVHAARHLVVGNPLPEHKLARRLKPVGGKGPMVVDGKTGQILHDPSKETTPAGHLIHNRLLNTRAGRMAIRAGQVGKFGFDATAGLPASWERLNKASDRMWAGFDKQRAHYSGVRKNWSSDWKAGAQDLSKDVPTAYNATKAGYNHAKSGYNHAYHRAVTLGEAYGPDVVNGMRMAYDSTLGSHIDPSDTSIRPKSSVHADVWDEARGRGPEYPFFEVRDDSATEPSDASIHADRPATTSPTETDLALGPGVVRPDGPAMVVADSDGMLVNPVTGEILADPGEAAAADIRRRISSAARSMPDDSSLEALRFRNSIGRAGTDNRPGSHTPDDGGEEH